MWAGLAHDSNAGRRKIKQTARPNDGLVDEYAGVIERFYQR
jgi:hypothetical protein